MPLTAHQTQTLRYLRLIAAIGAAAFAISIFFFCPRIELWRGLYIPFEVPAHSPEVNRAQQVLRQLHDPFIKEIGDEQSNRVIRWRLFFPILGHYLFLPDWLFLALPILGCFVVLAYVVHLILRERRDLWWALFAATIVATGSWFFVSTGWLSYNDSWYLLGLLAISFARPRIALALFCLFEPFIDERFVLSLPLAIVVRIIYFNLLARDRRRDLIIDLVVIASLSVPYVGLRLLLLRHADQSSQNYLSDQWRALREVSLATYLYGLWMGLRAAWVLVIALLWLVMRKKNWLINGLLIATVLFGIATSLLIAADIGRSSSSLFPAGVLGIILLIRQRLNWARLALPIVMAANLALPARHVITLFSVPIFYMHTEINRVQEPPDYMRPEKYWSNGMTLLNQHQFADARREFDVAIQLDDQYIPAFLNRALASIDLEDLDRADADINTLLARHVAVSDALLLRGIVYFHRGDLESGRRALKDALTIAPKDWAQRTTCENLLKQYSPKSSSSKFGL